MQRNIETLEERRKIKDMAQTFKLVTVHGIDKVDRVQLFKYVPEGRTRLAADPLNLRSEPARTDVRKNFYTQWIKAEWKKKSCALINHKTSKNVDVFKTNYRNYRHQMDSQAASNVGVR
jgi:oligoendopeptidase F